ncbi:MAG: sulfite oxidase-like oxidoreductase, partial [Elusimicrobia bacterium]|nr:sulfite oxidase-like oxidoreductase [Elusimicrobiota bacterium]
ARGAGGRLPPGQTLTDKFPVLDLGVRPAFDPAAWRFRVWGAVERPLEWTWERFRALPRARLTADFHCVTRWSRYDLAWEGVPVSAVLELVRPRPEAAFLVQHCAEGYTTNVPLADARGEDCLLADTLEGAPLPLEHGGPLRMLIPRLYAWKSGKFLVGLELSAVDKPGFWETRGYHNRADPWLDERYCDPASPPPGADDPVPGL